ncbi:MAG: trypsin-like serine protease [Phycisphaeraceae bacterium]
MAVCFGLSNEAQATELADIALRLVTADNAPLGGGHLAPGGALIDLPGMPAPLDADGVVSLLNPSQSVFSSGALIGDRYVLTAAHSVDATSSDSIHAVGFHTASGLTHLPVERIFIHPDYDRTIASGYDIAVLELSADAPLDAPRYPLYTASNELGQLSVKAGFGRTGHGSTGATSGDGLRRVGLNTWDAEPALFNSQFGHAMADHAYLMYDFDSGLSQNDAWGQHGGPSDTGFGEHEVNGVSGDSGGPTFLHDGARWRVAGVTAWGVGLDADPPDVTPGITDGSFGEISADTRVSSYAPFVQSVLDGSFVVNLPNYVSQGNHRPDNTWDRPNEQGTALAGQGQVNYHAYAFTVDQTGEYHISSQQNFDGVIHLYAGPLDVNNPLANLVAGNDNGPGGTQTSSLPALTLTQGQTYTLVTSGLDTNEVGTFLHQVEGPGLAIASPSVGGFVGRFAPERWPFSTDHADATLIADTAPGSLTLVGGNDLTGGETQLVTEPVPTTTTLRFDWTYFSEDQPGFDLLGVLHNDAFTLLTTGVDLFGTYEVTLAPGDTLGLRLFTPDGANGRAVVTIDRFVVVGDTDGDGDIDDADLANAFANYTGPEGGGMTFVQGDTDGDGDVDDTDLGTAFSAYTGPLGPASVPEPTSLALISLGTAALTRRRPTA